MRITVTLTDDTSVAVKKFSLATQVRFEKQFGMTMAALAPVTDEAGTVITPSPAGAEHMAFLAHTELLRAQKNGRVTGIPEDHDDFLDLVEDFTFTADEADAEESDPNPSPGSDTPSDS